MYYKLYLGEHINNGIPDNAIISGVVPKKHLKKAVQELARQHDFEIYIITPNNEIKAYYRDNLAQYFVDKDIEQ